MTLATWERRTELPLALLSVVFLVGYGWPILDPGIDARMNQFLDVVSLLIWCALALDLAMRIYLATPDRRGYALRHWYDFFLVLVPLLRPLRGLRLLSALRLLSRTGIRSWSGQLLTYGIGVTLLALLIGALTVLEAERDHPGANIRTFGDALWWACETTTTVGFGDFYPVTMGGRLMAVVLMFVGIGLVGSVTGSVGGWVMTRVRQDDKTQHAAARKVT